MNAINVFAMNATGHDANGTLTIDRYYDAKNNEINDPFSSGGQGRFLFLSRFSFHSSQLKGLLLT